MTDSKYLLGRDSRESKRLTTQHEWLVQLVGGTIHPSIPLQVSSSSGLRVADVATGTAVWLLDMAEALPSADTELHGFDVSSDQFPSPEQLPSNVSLHQHDVTKPFADEFLHSFDVVAVRLITAGMRGDDWVKAVSNVASLLKPGGYLQWIEPLHSSLRVANAKHGAPNAATRKTLELFHGACEKLLYPGPLRLPGLCTDQGLEEVALEVFAGNNFHDHNKVKEQGSLFLSGSCTVLMPHIVEGNKDGLKEKDVRDLVARSVEEMKGDIYLSSELQYLVSKKPNV